MYSKTVTLDFSVKEVIVLYQFVNLLAKKLLKTKSPLIMTK